jgi:hypothetical protein
MDPATKTGIQIIDTFWTAFSGLRLFFLVLDAVLVVVFFFALVKSFGVRPRFHGKWRPTKRVISLRQAVFREKWAAILKKFHGGSPEAMRITVIEADALVDEALKQMGLAGEHMADRLSRLTTEDVASLNRVWKAHRLRNDIVHRSGFFFPPEDGQAALDDYAAFLSDLGAI